MMVPESEVGIDKPFSFSGGDKPNHDFPTYDPHVQKPGLNFRYYYQYIVLVKVDYFGCFIALQRFFIVQQMPM